MNNSISEAIFEGEQRWIAPAQKIPYVPVAIARGEGALLYDYDEKPYVDMLSSGSSANIGHGNLEIADAVYEQMKRIAQYAMVYFSVKEPIDLAQMLVGLTGRADMAVAFSASGSASIDGAIKYARGYTGRSKLISFHESYHGNTLGAMSVSALSLHMRKKIGPLLSEVYHVPYPICIRCEYGKREETCGLECMGPLHYMLSHYVPPEEVAGIFMEPIAGDAGLVVPPVKYVRALHALCREHGILFISDEIQQGLGRVGRMFAMDQFGVESDIYVLGKSLGAGLPLGAVVARREILQSLAAPAHVFTLSGCSAVCAASTKMLEIMQRERIFEAALEKGAYLRARLEELQRLHPTIGDVRGMGLSIGVDLVKDPQSMEKSYEAAAKVCYYCIHHGVLLTFMSQNVLRVQPPLVITYAQLDTFVRVLGEALQAFEAGELGDEILDEMKGW